jgi:hypothetical protein
MSGDFRVIFPPGDNGKKSLMLSDINEETCAIGKKPIARHQVLAGETGRREKNKGERASHGAGPRRAREPPERTTHRGERARQPDRNGTQR